MGPCCEQQELHRPGVFIWARGFRRFIIKFVAPTETCSVFVQVAISETFLDFCLESSETHIALEEAELIVLYCCVTNSSRCGPPQSAIGAATVKFMHEHSAAETGVHQPGGPSLQSCFTSQYVQYSIEAPTVNARKSAGSSFILMQLILMNT